MINLSDCSQLHLQPSRYLEGFWLQYLIGYAIFRWESEAIESKADLVEDLMVEIRDYDHQIGLACKSGTIPNNKNKNSVHTDLLARLISIVRHDEAILVFFLYFLPHGSIRLLNYIGIMKSHATY